MDHSDGHAAFEQLVSEDPFYHVDKMSQTLCCDWLLKQVIHCSVDHLLFLAKMVFLSHVIYILNPYWEDNIHKKLKQIRIAVSPGTNFYALLFFQQIILMW